MHAISSSCVGCKCLLVTLMKLQESEMNMAWCECVAGRARCTVGRREDCNWKLSHRGSWLSSNEGRGSHRGLCFQNDSLLIIVKCSIHITCSLVRVLFLLSFVSCRLDKKFPPRSLMSVPEKCAQPVSAGVGWPLSVFDWVGGMCQRVASLSFLVPHWPLCGVAQLAMPCPHDPS